MSYYRLEAMLQKQLIKKKGSFLSINFTHLLLSVPRDACALFPPETRGGDIIERKCSRWEPNTFLYDSHGE